ncbi:MAG: MBL fold metallo-hydrolase [Coriobacteriia bacterium]|nr:MBL fold metallo-hydrolase [Coriobacteriia bacterium]
MEITETGLIYPNCTHQELVLLEEIRPNIYHSSYDMEGFPFATRLEQYAIVEPGKRALIIDTGWYEIIGTTFIDEMMDRFDIPWEKLEIFITHFHIDHEGNLAYCLSKGARVVYHGPHMPITPQRVEAFCVQSGTRRAKDFGIRMNVKSVGGRLEESLYYPRHEIELQEWDTIKIAGYEFMPVFTPGHACDHVCLYEVNEHFMFTGDHVTHGGPGLYQLRIDEHCIMKYLQSFDRIKALRPTEIYMAHHPALSSEEGVAMIDRSVASYERPLRQCYNHVLEAAHPVTAYEVTEIHNAKRENGIFTFDNDIRTRKVLNQFAYLEYLHDTFKIHRRKADDGAMEYYV